MRIIIDLQGCQSEASRLRGIGRYSMALIKALIKYQNQHEYILFANNSLRDMREDFKEEITSDKMNVKYFQWYSPGPINKKFGQQGNNSFIASELRSYAISLLDADIFFITSFFEGFLDNCLTDLSELYITPSIISIIYDLIPLINPKLYLEKNPLFSEFYHRKLASLSKFDSLLSISESSKSEAEQYLAFDQECLFNISSACDENLFASKVSNIKDDPLKIDYEYILYSGAGDPRKNLCRLIEAYALLSEELRNKYKLVFVGYLLPEELEQLKDWIASNHLSSKLVKILGYVSDEQLSRLYRNCSLFIFPSLHEGFGLPVLEAMTCGAPVIGSNTSSIPEIVGDANALFDPFDVADIAKTLEKALVDERFRELLANNSKNRSKLFSWKQTAENCINAFEKSMVINKNKSHNNKLMSYTQFIKRIKTIVNSIDDASKSDCLLKQISSSLVLIKNQIRYIKCEHKWLADKLVWRVEGPYDSTYSLAILNRQFALALKALDVDVKILSTEGPGDYAPDLKFLESHKDILKLHEDSRINNYQPTIISRNLYPPRVNDFDNGINILHSYGWEETEFPSEWIEEFNKNLDGLSVMSSQVKQILIDNGCQLPIKVTSLGVNHIKPNKDILSLDAKKFKFLHVSSCFPRKGISILLTAYGNAFSSKDDVSLIIKTAPNPHNNVSQILEQLILSNPSYPHVLIIDSDFSDIQMSSLFNSSNCLVAPSYGEGFGLLIAEAMHLGLPVITNGWGGQIDFCNHLNSWLLDFSFEYANTHFNLTSSVWAKPSESHLTELLKEVYCETPEVITSKLKAAKQTIKEYKWSNVAKKNISFVRNLALGSSFCESRIGWVSTWNSRCGIAAYSKHLIEYISDFKIILSPKQEDLIADDNLIVKRCWNLEGSVPDELEELYETIIHEKLTTVVVQFNYGFYNFDSLCLFINRLTNNKVNIIMMMHSTKDPVDNPSKKLSNLKKAFQKCSRILVHTPEDLNRLKDLDLLSNIGIFPHGILDFYFENNSNITSFKRRIFTQIMNDKTERLISAYGYCLPNKGFSELIKAIKILKDREFVVNLRLYAAIHSSICSKEYYLELLDLIDQYSLSNLIILDTTYDSDQSTLSKLSESDLIVFPYQNSNESSSASVRHGLASGVPVAVTPISIFSDVFKVVDVLPGVTEDLLAEGIQNWYLNKKISKKEKSLNEYQHAWRSQHRFSKLGPRLQGMIRGIELNN
ncbi:glycosyltransferase [Prochlorococcus sp. MIT 0801]|uniref:glycosyltransferase n=1 Tax=Prochlorococcus sp. MIT 0801 TaxID=1501269 RepID=UPI0004F58C52|nr:glycosyltransferase [Prochlorococcus sp. MIT 0801]AIQ98279.1 Glycosyltransferase [Prochlorococcus sp. MIT 0801]